MATTEVPLVRSIRRNLRSKSEVLTVLKTLSEKSTLHLKTRLLLGVIEQVDREV